MAPQSRASAEQAAVIGFLRECSRAENGLGKTAGGGSETGLQHSPRSPSYFSARESMKEGVVRFTTLGIGG